MTKVKILYVEDEPFLGRIVKESLESRDFVVHMATDGKQALTLFTSNKPDICVLDVMLPLKDGYSIAREIRQMDSQVPIIFVTAKTQTDDVLKGFETGGNDYIRKPFSMEELIVRINNLLAIAKPKQPGAAEKFTFGKYEFVVSRYELKIGEGVKKLSHREASLLKILCENLNTTVSRKDILMAVWGDDSFFNSRNLDVYITKLRDYLKQDPAVQIITIKGVGYHFAVS
ncbi:MAG: response regulator transcription factor [Flammeovirgaceae bacterium]|nr:MAG: response regulator transcription factor [Flammeovirgaceae bacterium]